MDHPSLMVDSYYRIFVVSFIIDLNCVSRFTHVYLSIS